MAYDADPRTLDWFERALSAAGARTRLRAIELLRDVDGPRRECWLQAASGDPDPRVAAMAVIVSALPPRADVPAECELFESDFATGSGFGSLEWEWEYCVVVCRGLHVPAAAVVVWTREEDDASAKELALLKACAGERADGDAVPIIVGKRFVNLYTRSARSLTEAMRWHREGRPTFRERP